MIEKPDATINFCIRQIQALKKIQMTGKNAKGLTQHVRDQLEFLERTFKMYSGSFVHYGYHGYLLTQHSELHKILLTLESSLLPSRVSSKDMQNKGFTITKTLIIKKAFGVYLDKLEQFLEEARIELQKEPPNA